MIKGLFRIAGLSRASTAEKRLREIMNAPKYFYLNDRVNSDYYDKTQVEAIEAALNEKILVITGGPGTGKSTITKGIISAYAAAEVLLAAPTGRAAKRLSEVTHMGAKTIHQLLEMRPPEGFQRDEDNKLEGDVLIVDECSMVDLLLMYSLLKAVPDHMTVISSGTSTSSQALVQGRP